MSPMSAVSSVLLSMPDSLSALTGSTNVDRPSGNLL